MKYISLSSQFYSCELPKFVNILKNDLKHNLENRNGLTIRENIEFFLNFFEKNNAFTFFQKNLIISDEMYVGFYLNNLESRIYLQRNLMCDYNLDENFLHEEYQIQYELGLNIEYNDERINKSYKLERQKNNEFKVWHNKKIKFENYKSLIFEKLSTIEGIIPNTPNYIGLRTNADV